MGVTGLWTIVQPCARPTPLPALNRKRLAVDASIWIYQFLKAVRDKEGNALRNSHIVGFFRRICKLLFHGIKPVFVFDGGAPVLKRQTVLSRKRRREGRREDAVRTAGRLLGVQMKRRAEEEEIERKRREREGRSRPVVEEEEVVPEEQLAYVDEIGMSAQQRQSTRKFHKKDAYHLPELTNGIEGMGRPEDPRIMSAEELEEYARQFNQGEDVNLYDFSKIDFNGEFFMSLPAGDRYNILNAARLRSRLRMGLSKEQLEEMFPDRMAFSKFQIERVRERNDLTQRLMNLNGMNSDGNMFGITGTGRIAGDRGREYVLVKNDGVEGGWALGVVSTEKGVGDRNKPIDVDDYDQKRNNVNLVSESEEDDFEDVPVEGLNRLPKVRDDGKNMTYSDFQAREIADRRKEYLNSRRKSSSRPARLPSEDPDSLFVDDTGGQPGPSTIDANYDDEDEDINRAIAMSLQQDQAPDDELDEEDHLNRAIELSLQKGYGPEEEEEEDSFEDVPMPEYEQRAVEDARPITKSSGKMIAHMVNNRANAAVPKRKEKRGKVDSDSDSDMDFQAALRKARKQKAPEKIRQAAPIAANKKNPFDGPLPFERLEFKTSLFGKKKLPEKSTEDAQEVDEEELAGGFEVEDEKKTARPLPPWLVGNDDIRSQVQQQRKRDQEQNAKNREWAEEDERIFQRDHGVIQVDSDDNDNDNDSDVEVLDKAPTPKVTKDSVDDLAEIGRAEPPQFDIPQDRQPPVEPRTEDAIELLQDSDEPVEWSESDYEDAAPKSKNNADASKDVGGSIEEASSKSKSPSPVFEDVDLPDVQATEPTQPSTSMRKSLSPVFEDVEMADYTSALPSRPTESAESPIDDAYDRQEAEAIPDEFDFSDPEEEELMTQLAIEAEEHARFASTLNNKSEKENQDSYEKELKALRSQQKKDRRDADEVSHIMITECQALLRLFGIPYITAPMEAEAQCAELVRLGLVDGIVTDDSDIFLFGGTRVYKNLFNSNKLVECYLSSDLEKELSLSRDQLISIAHLLGSDYTEGIPGIGPVTAVEILSEFPSSTGLEEFKEWWSAVQNPLATNTVASEPTLFRKKFRRSQATKLFLPPAFPSPAVTEAYLKPDVDSTPEAFQWGVPDLGQLREFLMGTVGWSQERVDEILVPVIRDMNRRETEGTQSNITRYFDGAVGVGANANANGERSRDSGSKRMREAVGKLKAKKKKGANPLQSGSTFADDAREWARKNELSIEAQQKKVASRKGKGKGNKRTVEEVDGDADGDGDGDDNDGLGEEENEADGENDDEPVMSRAKESGPVKGKGRGNGNGNGNGQGQAAKRKKTKG
ncbi:DNA repair protein rad2 [Ciborinia camelliae]|nr:DNA repair protein rad2 [Ciborinia camelliae]